MFTDSALQTSWLILLQPVIINAIMAVGLYCLELGFFLGGG